MSGFGDSEGMAQVDFIAHVVVMPIVLSIGMINQCLNVCTLLHLPPGCFMYLKASAIADILSIITFVPFLLRQAQLNDPSWEAGMLYHAHIELPLINALITASALNIVAMTVDRYLSVCHPIKFFHASDSKLRSLCVIFCLYMTAFLVYVPSIWQKKIVKTTKDNGSFIWEIQRNKEVEEMQLFRIYLLLRESFSRWGPVIILVVLNMAMVRSLRKLDKRQSKWGRSSRLSRNARTRSVRSARDDRGRISALLLVTSTTFIICNLPASFLSLFVSNITTHTPSTSYQIFRSVSNLLQVTSYLYNFYLYALCSSEYRQAFLRLLGCKKLNSPFSTGDSPTIRVSNAIRRGQIQTVVDFDQGRGIPETLPLNEI